MSLPPLPTQERIDIEQRLHKLGRLAENLQEIDRILALSATQDGRLGKLRKGINATVTSEWPLYHRRYHLLSLAKEFGRATLASPSDPPIRLAAAKQEHISKRGHTYADSMLVKAARAAVQWPWPAASSFYASVIAQPEGPMPPT